MLKSFPNYHSHTNYCDGTNPLEDYIIKAIELNMPAYGFSSHVPLPFKSKWSMNSNNVNDYLLEIEQLKIKYLGIIEIYKSMEIDFADGIIGSHSPEVLAYKLDYTIGSIHYGNQLQNGNYWEIDGTWLNFQLGLKELFGNDFKNAIKWYLNETKKMIETSTPDIVGHLDKIKIHFDKMNFSEEEKWYQNEMFEILKLIQKKNIALEINTRGIYKKLSDENYPSNFVIKAAKRLKVPMVLNSDCHHPKEMNSNFENTADYLISCGIKTLRVLFNNQWQDVPFSRSGIILE